MVYIGVSYVGPRKGDREVELRTETFIAAWYLVLPFILRFYHELAQNSAHKTRYTFIPF